MKLDLKIGILLLLNGVSISLFAQDFQLIAPLSLQAVDSTFTNAKQFYQANYPINPAYLNENRDLSEQVSIEPFYSKTKHKKQFAPLQGTDFDVYGFQASWFTPLDTTANFKGTVRFSKGNQNGVYGNTMRLSEEYGPYLMINRKEADFKFQQYDLNGTYNKKIAATTLGVQLYYLGDYSYKLTDPRAKAIAAWFGLHVGGKYDFSPQHTVGVSTTYELHTQHVELDVWKGNIKQQFLLLRGFGLYDHDYKDQVFSKKRQYKQQKMDLNLTASLWKKERLTIEVLLEGGIKNMKTEEESTINLFRLTTTSLFAQTKLNYKVSRDWHTQFEVTYTQQKLTGKENRYSYQRVNEDYSGVYDYVKIGSIEPYTLHNENVRFAWKWSYSLAEKWVYQMGVHYVKWKADEKYQQTTFRSLLEKDKPALELNLHYVHKKHQVRLVLYLEKENTTKALLQKDESYDSLYEELYEPLFLFQSLDKTILSFAVDYKYNIKNQQQIGIKTGFSKIVANKTKLKKIQDAKVDTTLFSLQLYYQF